MIVVELDAEQKAVAEAGASARQIVLAGPGAGKTETVGARCRHLVEAEKLYPEEILLISFSNAAVDVVRRRTADIVNEGHGLDVSTIDRLAAVTRAEVEGGEPEFRSYDSSVRDATKLLTSENAPLFDGVRHVIVDEVQDVVGVRARFVLAFLRHGVPSDCGFTLLGDPLQSLYDFQLASDDVWTAAHFLEQVRRAFDTTTTTLAGEYRAATEDARRAASERSSVSEKMPGSKVLALQRVLDELSPLGPLDEDAVDTIAAWSGTTVLLCDTNARAALAADELAAAGVRVEMASRATEPSVDPCLSRAFAAWPTGRIERPDFIARLDDLGVDDPGEWWLTCLEKMGDVGALDLGRLSHALGAKRPPRELLRRPSGAVVVSTVHRAKGLEFDNVVLVDPDRWRRADLPGADSAYAAQLFVALSRARRRLTTVEGIDARSWRKNPATETWEKRAFRGRGVLGVLVEPRHLVPIPLDVATADSHVGAVVSWSPPEEVVVDDDILPRYTAEVGGSPAARTGDEFAKMILKASFHGDLPLLTGGRVEALETRFCAPRPDAPHGIFLAARISGPLTTSW